MTIFLIMKTFLSIFIKKLIIYQPERIRKRWQYNAISYILHRLLHLQNPLTVWLLDA